MVLASAFGERGLSCLYRTDGFPFVVPGARGGGEGLFKAITGKSLKKWNIGTTTVNHDGLRV